MSEWPEVALNSILDRAEKTRAVVGERFPLCAETSRGVGVAGPGMSERNAEVTAEPNGSESTGSSLGDDLEFLRIEDYPGEVQE
ncbi:hypothetical protein [Nocardia sp. NPDC005998]|uniref:hypothetical protein n=1 Tax=Nocardia sp. NPDC005998 TaxID=3156894 RepID=UPI0033BFAE5D